MPAAKELLKGQTMAEGKENAKAQEVAQRAVEAALAQTEVRMYCRLAGYSNLNC